MRVVVGLFIPTYHNIKCLYVRAACRVLYLCLMGKHRAQSTLRLLIKPSVCLLLWSIVQPVHPAHALVLSPELGMKSS